MFMYADKFSVSRYSNIIVSVLVVKTGVAHSVVLSHRDTLIKDTLMNALALYLPNTREREGGRESTRNV